MSREELATLSVCQACDGLGRVPAGELPCGEACCGYDTEACPECKGLGIRSTMPPTMIKPGTGATLCMYSDRNAYTITRMAGKRTLYATRDIATRTDSNGVSEDQQYTYTTDPSAVEERFFLTKKGLWTGSSGILFIGARREYYDYSF